MPEVFADQQACSTKTRIERPDLVSPGKEAPFVKQTVCGQVNFVMDMENASAGEIGGGNEKAVTGVLVNEAHHQVQVLTRFEKMFENRIVFHGSVRDAGDQILYDVSC